MDMDMDADTVVLKLYISGKPSNIEPILANFRSMLDNELDKNYKLVIYDVIENPQAAEDAKILATPTLVRVRPLPARRIIGDILEAKRLFTDLDIVSKGGK